MEWNINQRSNYGDITNIPNVIIEKIKNIKADIIVLTEFFKVDNYKDFISDLEKENYTVFLDPRKAEKNKNQILIAISNKIYISNGGQLKWLPNDINGSNPNLLQVEVQFKDKSLTIIGTRIRVNNTKATIYEKRKFIKDQLETLENYLRGIHSTKVISIGDFNIWHTWANKNLNLPQEYTITGPKFNMNSNDFKSLDNWSFVFEDGSKAPIDFIISKNITLSNLKYDWDFVTPNNGYGYLKPEDDKSDLTGLPDHAILTASIKI